MFRFSSRKLFYNTLEDVMTNHEKRSYRWLHTFECCAYAVYICRFAYILLCLLQPTKCSLIEIDFFSHLIENLSTDKDYFFAVTFVMMFVSCVVMERAIYFSRIDTCTWGIIEDQIIHSEQIFKQCLLPEDERKTIWKMQLGEIKRETKLYFIPELMVNWFCKIWAQIIFWKQCDAYDLAMMKSYKWKYTPGATIELRAKMYRVLAFLEMANCLVIVSVYVIFFFLLAYFYQLFLREGKLSTQSSPFVVIDLALFYYLGMRTLKMFLWLSTLSTFSGLFFNDHFTSINARLFEAVRLRKQMAMSYSTFCDRLVSYLEENTIICMEEQDTNTELWGSCVGWICVCQFPGSIYVVYRILDNQLEGSKWLFTCLLMSIELAIIVTSLLPLAKYAKTTLLTHTCLPAAQQLIQADRLNLKLKYMCLYERLNSEIMFGVTIGFYNSISYKTIFEVFLMYFAYTFFFFDLFK